MADPACKNCRYWGGVVDWSAICRYSPPVVILDGNGNIDAHCWPETTPDDWCGKFEPRLSVSITLEMGGEHDVG